MGLIDRLAPRRPESAAAPTRPAQAGDPEFATKALRKFLASLSARSSPVLVDLGPVVGSNVTFFGEQLGCKIFVEDIYADLARHIKRNELADLPAFLKKRFPHPDFSVDGILCWDLIDYLDRPSGQALAAQLMRLLRPDGVLLAFFGTGQVSREAQYTKYLVVDQATLKYRTYAAPKGRHALLVNRDILKMFGELRVSDSFLLKNNIREILFRKPA